MNGYADNILRINLTDREITIIPTSNYSEWGGGHGIGSAIFFDLVKDKTIDGFDPENIVTLMTSPLSGTLVPGASGRTEVQGIGVQSSPIGWFTRSNFGGRFSAMLKYAGWDGIVIEGKADTPVWIDIRNDNVEIRDCSSLSLWGKDTWDCQETIWDYVAGSGGYEDWVEPNGIDGGRTTQRSAVVAIGPAGENLVRMACLIHDASNASGQSGFGAVWGSKNLKAISVIGTGSIHINDPKGLMQARLSQMKDYAFDLDNPGTETFANLNFSSPPVPLVYWGLPPGTGRPTGGQRPQACVGCHSGCRARYESGLGNEASCMASLFYIGAHTNEIQYKACDLLNKYGLNAFEMYYGLWYLMALFSLGILGPGKDIDCPLNFEEYGSLEFAEQLVKMIAFRNDGQGNTCEFGDDIAEGFYRAAKKWGRLEGDTGDLKTGLLPFSCWGLPDHRDPRGQLEWGYGTILGDRDINEHDFRSFNLPPMPSEELVTIYTDKMVPFEGDRLMLDYSTDNMYSEHIAKLVAWHRYYTRFWKQSALYCDWRWPDFTNSAAPNNIGSTGEAEPSFFNLVTGEQLTFLDGIEIGRKIWNLDQAIWTLQGRDRDMVHFADYMYSLPLEPSNEGAYILPGRKNGSWTYVNTAGRYIDREKFEEFKTRFYTLAGWDSTTGYPTRSTLESLGLGYVADELEKTGRLGEE
jgi:aldehyde:ferredoxin oxidoreductase